MTLVMLLLWMYCTCPYLRLLFTAHPYSTPRSTCWLSMRCGQSITPPCVHCAWTCRVRPSWMSEVRCSLCPCTGGGRALKVCVILIMGKILIILPGNDALEAMCQCRPPTGVHETKRKSSRTVTTGDIQRFPRRFPRHPYTRFRGLDCSGVFREYSIFGHTLNI